MNGFQSQIRHIMLKNDEGWKAVWFYEINQFYKEKKVECRLHGDESKKIQYVFLVYRWAQCLWENLENKDTYGKLIVKRE